MRIEREYRNGEKFLQYQILLQDQESSAWSDMTQEDRKEMLQILEFLQKDIGILKKKIGNTTTKIEEQAVIKTHKEVILQVEEWFSTPTTQKKIGWDSLWILEKTGDVVYSQYMPPPTADGYIKGFQIAFDAHTDKMVARNCDNIWKSLNKRGYVRLEDMNHFRKFYKGYK